MILAIAAARGLYFAALMLLFGSAAFEVLLKKQLPFVAPVLLPRRGMLLAALAAALVWFALAAAQMADAADLATIRLAATATLFGNLFVLRVAVLLGLLLLPARRLTGTAVLAAAALSLPSATSHAATASPAGLAATGTILDAVHLLTCGFWIGGLAVLIALFRRKDPNMLQVLSLFSDTALVAVLLLAMTGMINIVTILLVGNHVRAPVYLAVLGAKLALVGIMLALALVNRFALTEAGEHPKIARNAVIELGLGLIVVLLAGLLGQLSPVQ
ncbi:MAG: CopD family protein [Alphaproteobacteria bacterium]|nr:CopD family protein [Alphaproteobacteria bacterium]